MKGIGTCRFRESTVGITSRYTLVQRLLKWWLPFEVQATDIDLIVIRARSFAVELDIWRSGDLPVLRFQTIDYKASDLVDRLRALGFAVQTR